MRLCREIQYGVRLAVREDARHRIRVGDVRLHKHDATIADGPLEIEQASGVSQLVDDDEAVGSARERVVNKVGADETGSSRDEECGHPLD